MSINAPRGILPNYLLVRSFGSANEETLAFDAQRYPVVTAARQALKKGESYGSNEGEVCIVKLNRDSREYEFDSIGEENTFNRPAARKSTNGKTVDINVRIPNAQLQRDLRAHAQLSIAMAGMEKADGLENSADAVQSYLETTFQLLAQLPGIDRSHVSRMVNATFPKSEHVPAN